MPEHRPAISVVVAFAGDRMQAELMLDLLSGLRLEDGDELIIVDNSATPVAREVAGDTCRVIEAPELQTPYYARNVGIERSANDWLLITDSDCRPEPSLLDDYFATPISDRCGAVAGVLEGGRQRSLAARYARARGRLEQSVGREWPYKPFAVTANLLVRRAAWEDVGGFYDDIREGGDSDFSWRLQDAGWELGFTQRPRVEHLHRETVRGLMRQVARDGASEAWLNRRYPGSSRRPAPQAVPRCLVSAAGWAALGRPRRGLYRALDACVLLAEAVGYGSSNSAARLAEPAPVDVVLVADTFRDPAARSMDERIRVLADDRRSARVEALARAARPVRGGSFDPRLAVNYAEDDGLYSTLTAVAWLVARHPLGCCRDLLSRLGRRRGGSVPVLRALAPGARRLAERGERHLEAHSAGGAPARARRLGRLLRL